MYGETLYKNFIYVVLITLAVVIIVPVAWVFLASIKQNSEFYGNPWALPASFYWQNFVNAWNAASMGSYMLNSVLVTALSLALLLVVALPAAYCLSRFQFTGRKLLNTCFMAWLFINVNYIVVPIFLMLRDWDSWMKYLFKLNNVFMNNLVTLAVVYAATALPFTIYLLSGYFATLPHDFEEAAYIDGAGYGQAMIRIIFPMAQPSIITIILFKLEGQKILRHPEFNMSDRLLLDKIDYENKCITIGWITYPLADTDFPTVDREHPYDLYPEESQMIDQLTASFQHS